MMASSSSARQAMAPSSSEGRTMHSDIMATLGLSQQPSPTMTMQQQQQQQPRQQHEQQQQHHHHQYQYGVTMAEPSSLLPEGHGNWNLAIVSSIRYLLSVVAK
eukprot:GHVU01067555.1.p1 GENE.GHVU01067555.1~~GHVU01067555.1.p1  ORF type:complete len:103 (+),score=30.75 GHVU01067555.1:872-1180(+)